MIREFKEFIAKGSAIDLAVGVIIGAAFNAIVRSIVDDMVMPVIGFLLNDVDFENMFVVLSEGDPAGAYRTLTDAQAAGAVTLNYGRFLNATVSFLLVAFVVFLMVKAINKLRKPAPESPVKECPRCLSVMPEAATKCPACTVDL
ncbi:MAG: large conductance mechanosensitive channel protein MscL [Actinobacteria bacterium HGW-Actinobacteria-10]|nr:MAG: large conductance mechanosensitive channel protein MscL [Actinobacteria bacterium HGW-Actinobacteria-10]